MLLAVRRGGPARTKGEIPVGGTAELKGTLLRMRDPVPVEVLEYRPELIAPLAASTGRC